MTTKATPRWRIKLGIGIVIGLVLSGYGFLFEDPFFMWGALYLPVLSLLNTRFWTTHWFNFCKIIETGFDRFITFKPSLPKRPWQKRLIVGSIIGLILGTTGIFTDNAYLAGGFLYAPLLSLTNEAFWLGLLDRKSDIQRLDESIQDLNKTIKRYGLPNEPVKMKTTTNTRLQEKNNSPVDNIKSIAIPDRLKHLRIGVIAGILLGIIGLISGASWLTWGFFYAPALSLTNKTFWGVIWKMLGAKDGDNFSSSNQRLDDEDDSSFDLREEDKGNHYHSHYHGHY